MYIYIYIYTHRSGQKLPYRSLKRKRKAPLSA